MSHHIKALQKEIDFIKETLRKEKEISEIKNKIYLLQTKQSSNPKAIQAGRYSRGIQKLEKILQPWKIKLKCNTIY